MKSSAVSLSGSTNNAGINYINMGLMVISLAACYVLPFEVFLFSYAILGPLHYLTEISWLDKKNYFVSAKKDIWLFVLFVIAITIGLFHPFGASSDNSFVASFLFAGFVYALVILYTQKTVFKLLFVGLAFLVSLIFHFNTYPNFPFLLFALWLPTIVHVYFFTGGFILYGALKSKSASGISSFVLFVLCGVLCFVYLPENFGLSVTEYGKKAYSYFSVLNVTLYKAFGFGTLPQNDDSIFYLPNALAVMRFIAFSYTYHYLNWFSKTTVIKWNQISKQRMFVIAGLWILSVALYIFSYKVGFYALFLLSMLHVFFEFPLNHQTFIGIGKEVRSLVKR